MGDIGTHAANMVEYITGKKIIKLLAKVNIFVEGRLLEDDGNVLITLEDNIEGNLMTSQIATGEENDLKIRVWGDNGGIEWKHSSPNTLLLKLDGNPNLMGSDSTISTTTSSDFNLNVSRTSLGNFLSWTFSSFSNLFKYSLFFESNSHCIQIFKDSIPLFIISWRSEGNSENLSLLTIISRTPPGSCHPG